jgi:NarL family two-component system response regulator LiaR
VLGRGVFVHQPMGTNCHLAAGVGANPRVSRALHLVNMHGRDRGETGPWRAVVADDDALARRTIAEVLQRAGIVLTAEATDGDEAVELVREHEPDLVVMDTAMPRLDGIAATRRIVGERPDQVVILLTTDGSDDLGILGLSAGAMGYLRKDVDLDAMSRALLAALHGEAAISRRMARVLIEHLRCAPAPGNGLRPVHSPLTTREWEVLDLVCEGKTTDEIAAEFVVSPETIRTHIKRVLRKLGVSSRQEAVALTRRTRIVGH